MIPTDEPGATSAIRSKTCPNKVLPPITCSTFGKEERILFPIPAAKIKKRVSLFLLLAGDRIMLIMTRALLGIEWNGARSSKDNDNTPLQICLKNF
jgi:hypothetical protein